MLILIELTLQMLHCLRRGGCGTANCKSAKMQNRKNGIANPRKWSRLKCKSAKLLSSNPRKVSPYEIGICLMCHNWCEWKLPPCYLGPVFICSIYLLICLVLVPFMFPVFGVVCCCAFCNRNCSGFNCICGLGDFFLL